MSLLIVVAFMDWDTMEIDMIIVGLIFLLFIPSAIFTDRVSLLHRIIGAFAISLPFYIIGEISRVFIRKKTGEDYRAIELGDTILMFAAGALLGTKAIIVSALIGIVVAARRTHQQIRYRQFKIRIRTVPFDRYRSRYAMG